MSARRIEYETEGWKKTRERSSEVYWCELLLCVCLCALVRKMGRQQLFCVVTVVFLSFPRLSTGGA